MKTKTTKKQDEYTILRVWSSTKSRLKALAAKLTQSGKMNEFMDEISKIPSVSFKKELDKLKK